MQLLALAIYAVNISIVVSDYHYIPYIALIHTTGMPHFKVKVPHFLQYTENRVEHKSQKNFFQKIYWKIYCINIIIIIAIIIIIIISCVEASERCSYFCLFPL